MHNVAASQTPDPRKRSKQPDAGWHSGHLLLLDSSDGGSNVAEYAFHLASANNWQVSLLHVIDLDRFPESGNPATMARLLSEEQRRCNSRLELSRQMIECTGIQVNVGRPSFVSLFQLGELQENIQHLEPDLVILGRGAFSKGLLAALVRQMPFPALIVPEMQVLRKPKSLLLYSDGRRLRESELLQVLDFAARTQQQISVLSVEKRKNSGVRKFQSYLASPAATSLVNFYRQDGSDSVLTVDSFLRKRSFDMLSIIMPDRGWLRRLFSRWNFIDLAHAINVPLLIFKEGKA